MTDYNYPFGRPEMPESNNPFSGDAVPLVGGREAGPSKKELEEFADREREMQRVGGIAAMRNEFAAAALNAFLVRGVPETDVIERSFALGQKMAEYAATLIEKDLARFAK